MERKTKKLFAKRNADGTYGPIQEIDRVKNAAPNKKGNKVLKNATSKKLFAKRNADGTYGPIQEIDRVKKSQNNK